MGQAGIEGEEVRMNRYAMIGAAVQSAYTQHLIDRGIPVPEPEPPTKKDRVIWFLMDACEWVFVLATVASLTGMFLFFCFMLSIVRQS